MKKLIIITFCFCGFSSFKNISIDMNEVRSLYQKAVYNENSCEKLIEISTSINENNNLLLLGYKGCGTMLMAKHVFNPFSKMSYFKKGKQMLECAIDADSNNIELRFLRFTAQTNMPSLLGYNVNIESDKKFILYSLLQVKDRNLKQFMMPVLEQSKYLTSSEKQQLR